MENDIKKILVTKEEIENICSRLGKAISIDYKDKNPVFIGLLKGCEPFMSDLLKHVDCYAQVEYMRVSSYVDTESTGTTVIRQDLTRTVDGEDIILVDDIVDTGKTIHDIVGLLKSRNAKSVEVCCLIDKPEGRKINVDVKYVGGMIPKEFVVGYGLDYNEYYRNLPYIGVLKEEVYKK